MKWLALLLLVVLAEGSDDRRNPKKDYRRGSKKQYEPKYDDTEDFSLLEVDHDLIVDEYEDAALTFPPPAIEHGDCGAEQFKKDYTRIGARWGQSINDIIYDQGVAVGNNLIKTLEDKYNTFIDAVDKKSKEEDNSVDAELLDLANQIRSLLTFKPGNQTIHHKPLPKLPTIPTKIVSQTKNRTAFDFFLNLPDFFDEDMSSIYGYVAGIYLRGWHNTRKYFNIQQTEYRNQILNGPVLSAYRKITDKVYRIYDDIENRANKTTLNVFKSAGNFIIRLSNEWREVLRESELSEKRD